MTEVAQERAARESRFAEFLRFGVAGVANTAFGFGAYSALVLLGIPVSVSLLVATVIGILFNFLTFGAFAFRQLDLRRLPRFLLAYTVVYLVNLALLDTVRSASSLGPIASQLACLLVIAPAAYFLLRATVFRMRDDG
jgi:putative flippase GtrA